MGFFLSIITNRNRFKFFAMAYTYFSFVINYFSSYCNAIIYRSFARDFTRNNPKQNMDGIFITASDLEIFKMARSASILCTTPRVGINIINKSNVLLDGLIGSNLDPGEIFSLSELCVKPKYTIKTEGERGGLIFPGGRYEALKNNKLKVDSYGCGDSFAAGILYGMASKWNIDKSLNLAKVLGRNASEFFGPYKKINDLKIYE